MHLTDDGGALVFADGDRLAFVTLDLQRLVTEPRTVTNDEVSWEGPEVRAAEGEPFTVAWIADDSDAILWPQAVTESSRAFMLPAEEFRASVRFTILCGDKR